MQLELFSTNPVHDLSTSQVIDAVRDSIQAGLIPEKEERFEHMVRTLTDADLEDYLQDLWDEI